MPAESYRLRLGRYCEPGRPYLLTTATHQRQPLFHDFDLARLLVAQLRAANDGGWATSLVWVVMPDHLHWLVELHDRPLGMLMRGSRTTARGTSTADSVVRECSGSRDSMIAPFARKKTFCPLRVTSSPILCGRGWSSASAITRCGMPAGYEA